MQPQLTTIVITAILVAAGEMVWADETACEQTIVANCLAHEAGRSDESRHGASPLEYCQKVASLYCGSAEYDSATGTIRPKANLPGINAPGPAPSDDPNIELPDSITDLSPGAPGNE
jgi:hypothetical protein